MSAERWELPEGWRWTTVGDVIEEAQPGFASGQKGIEGGIRHLRMNNIGADCRLNLDSVITVPLHLAQPRHLLRRGDVLFCHTNSQKLVGKTALFDVDDGDYAFSNHLTRLRVKPEVADPRWLWHTLATLWRERYFETRCKQWVNQATVERETLLSAPIPLPPLPQQRRIVTKLEAMLGQNRAARAALGRVPTLLKRFRQSVLAAAFRGALTKRDPHDEPASALLERIRAKRRRKWEEDLRARGKDPKKAHYVEPAPPDTRDLPELPEGWVWAGVGEVIELLQYGTSVKADADAKSGVSVLRMGNIQDGKIDFNDLKFIDPTKDDISKYLLQTDDILINRTNSPELVGKAAIFKDEGRYVFASYLIRLRANPELLSPDYLVSVINSDIGRRYVATVKHQVAGQANINSQNIREMPVPLAPLPEQRRLVARIENLFAQAAAIEAAVAAARQRADKLDQAILAKAFRGELTS